MSSSEPRYTKVRYRMVPTKDDDISAGVERVDDGSGDVVPEERVTGFRGTWRYILTFFAQWRCIFDRET